MRPRRIFKPAYRSRRWAGFAVATLAAVGALTIAVVLPTDLFGSAPRNQAWDAPAAEVQVVDGETLRVRDRTLRLNGLAAPGRGQLCDSDGRRLDCGSAAAAALARLVADRPVECRLQGRDRHGRGLALCRAGGVELNASQVAAGWALANATAPAALLPLEAAARDGRRGLWAGGFQPPESWRRRD